MSDSLASRSRSRVVAPIFTIPGIAESRTRTQCLAERAERPERLERAQRVQRAQRTERAPEAKKPRPR